MTKAKKETGNVPKPSPWPAPPPCGDVRGRALVDIPGIARCGEFVTLPMKAAADLEAGGQFDPRACEPESSQ